MNRLMRRLFLCGALALPSSLCAQVEFQWSGVDGNTNTYSITMVARNVSNGETGFEVNLWNAAFIDVTTETTSQTALFTSVSSGLFGGSLSLPNADANDPGYRVVTSEDGGNTDMELYVGADTSDIGLTFSGNPVNSFYQGGVVDFAYSDPTTLSEFTDFFPQGTYSVTGGYGEIAYNGSSDFLSIAPQTLTITHIPEPGAAALVLLSLAAGLASRRTWTRRR